MIHVTLLFTQNEACVQNLASSQQHHKELQAFAQILDIDIDETFH